MSLTVNVAHVHAFQDYVQHLAQQKQTKLRGSVRVRTNVKGKSDNWERLGAAELQTVTTRHGATVLLNPEHSRRRCTFVDAAGAIGLDDFDEAKLIISPENEYPQVLAAAVNRYYDNRIITAATAAATTVSAADAEGTATLPAGQQIAAGGTGLTFEKVNQAARILNSNDVPNEDRTFVISAQGLEDLLAEVEVTSSDFSSLMALKNGQLNGTWMGFSWIMSNLLTISSTTRSCLAYHKNAIGLSIGIDQKLEIDRRPDLNGMWQANMKASAGAVRIEEALLVQVDITES